MEVFNLLWQILEKSINKQRIVFILEWFSIVEFRLLSLTISNRNREKCWAKTVDFQEECSSIRHSHERVVRWSPAKSRAITMFLLEYLLVWKMAARLWIRSLLADIGHRAKGYNNNIRTSLPHLILISEGRILSVIVELVLPYRTCLLFEGIWPLASWKEENIHIFR